MKTLVLAEKPSVGKEIATVLRCNQKNNGYYSNSQYIVSWAMGHLVTLAEPEYYYEQWKEWNLEYLPMIPDKMDLVIIKNVGKQYNIVKGLLNQAKDLIIATDSGREGELVARWIMKKTNFKKPFKRLWISSLTNKSIKEGFSNLKPGNFYDYLYHQAEGRSIADWLVGLNVTRALSCKYQASLSAGRVQTPTLNMIVSREEERRKFVSKKYYQIQINVNNCWFNYVNKDFGIVRLFDYDKVLKLSEELKRREVRIHNINRTIKKTAPPLLYDLAELQREGNKRFGYSAKKTLDIIQSLYERHKYLTYPRTDSRYLTKDMYDTIKDRLRQISFADYRKHTKELLKGSLNNSKRIFDDGKVTDHHAIIPTDEYVDISVLNPEEYNIYNLVVKRFMAVFMEDFVYEQTSIILKSESDLFTIKGRVVKNLGFKGIGIDRDEEEEDDDNELPVFSGNSFKISAVRINSLQTEPPKRFTEGTLLSAMEHPQNFITEQKYKNVLEKCSGIGTAATRAEIIERLFQAGYIELVGKEIASTKKGKQLINLVPEKLKSATLTAKWEEELALIKNNNKEFIERIISFTKELIMDIKKSENNYRHDNITNKICPNCGKNLLKESNKYGERLVCVDFTCGYKTNVSRVTNARCPTCFKKLSIVEGEQKRYICSCGFKASFDNFNEKLALNKQNMRKREIDEYLKKQNKKEEKLLSPFMLELTSLKDNMNKK